MHRWRVFAIVSVGVFMAGLDLFIVNIAFPDIRARLRRDEPRRPVLDPERLRDRVRRAARAGRAHLRPRRAQARLPRRPRALPRRLGRVAPPRPRSRCSSAARDRCRPRARRSWCRPRSASCSPSSRPPSARPRSAPGRRSAASPPRPARRSAACWSRRAGGWVFLVNLPVGLVALVAAARTLQRAPRPRPGPAARRARRGDARERRSRCSCSASSRARIGAGPAPACSASFAAAAVLVARVPRCAPRATPRRSSSCRCCACARSRSRTSARSSSSPRSPRCCSRGVLFMTGVWHYSVLRAGLQPRARAR